MAAELPDKDKEAGLPVATAEKPSQGLPKILTPKISSTVFKVLEGGVKKDESVMDILDRLALKDAGVREIMEDCAGLGIDLSFIRNRLVDVDKSLVVSDNFFKLLSTYLLYLENVVDRKRQGIHGVTLIQRPYMISAARDFISSLSPGSEDAVIMELEGLSQKIAQLRTK